MNQPCACCGKPATTAVEHIRILQTTFESNASGYRKTETSTLAPLPYCEPCSRHAWGAERQRRSETIRFDVPSWGVGLFAWLVGLFVLRTVLGLVMPLLGAAAGEKNMGPIYMVWLGLLLFSVLAIFSGLPRKLGGRLLASFYARNRTADCSFQGDEPRAIERLIASR